MIYNNNITVEEIIRQSVKESKLSRQKERRNWVRRMLDYYGGNYREQYIQDYFISASSVHFVQII